MTQYLTKAQGMPSEIEKRLSKRIRTFMWDHEGTPPISTITLNLPQTEGGRKLLNIEVRNKAIHLTWLKSYLQMNCERPTWAYIADELINSKLPNKPNIDGLSRTNIFLQSWNSNPNAKTKIPKDLTAMIRAGNEHKVKLQALLPTQELKEEMPIWFHIGAYEALKELTNKTEAKCLRHKHQVKYVSHLRRITTEPLNGNHRPQRNCRCTTCREIKQNTQCKNPHKCRLMAQTILDKLTPKWSIQTHPPNDNLDLTPRRKNRNKQAEKTGEPILFDPNITTNSIKDSFRIFTTNRENDQIPSHRVAQQAQAEEIVVYTDGSCINNGQEDAQAGSGIWYGENNPRNKALKVPGKAQSNQTGELYAVLHVARTTPKEIPLLIKSDSEYVIEGLTKNLS